MANQYHNGMLSGRKIFFHNVKKSSSRDKIKRILKRLEAEIVEIYDGGNIDVVIYDEISRPFNSTDRKRKNDSPIGFQPKRQRLNACIKNILLNNKTNESIENSNNSNNNIKRSDSTLSQFLTIAKEKGSKVKSTNEVWQWLSKYYKWLIETDEPDELIDRNSNLDSYHRVKYLNMPSLKICDPFGDGQPLILENYSIEKSIWLEFINEHHEISYELNRKSTGTSRKMKKTMNDGYCENCREYYQDLCQHINTNKHNLFAENNANFREIDRFIAQTQTVYDFFLVRKSLWDKHKKSKTSLFSLPSSMKQISIHENIDNSIPQHARVSSPKQVNVESNSSSTSSSDTESDSSSESSTESDSSSTESKNNIKITNNYISSTPINKMQKPNFFSPDSISTEDQQQQSQLSSHVNDVIENLDSQLSKNDNEDDDNDDVMICSQLNRLLRSNCPKYSPVISRRFDWCKECKRNHVPVDAIDNYQCTLSPLKIENCVIELNKNIKFPVDIDETFNTDETHEIHQSDNNDEAVFTKLNHKFAKNLVLSNEIIDLNSEISNTDAINSDNIQNINTNREVDLFSNVAHLIKTGPDDYSTKLDEIGIEKVVEKQESIDETVKTSNNETGFDGSQINEILSHVDNENDSQVIDKDSHLTNTDKFNKSVQNNEIEYKLTSNISEAEIQNENNSKPDMIDTIDSDKEFSSSSSPNNVVFIQCSVNLERINYKDDENVQNIPTNSANEISFHPVLELSDKQSVMREQIHSKINICQKFQPSNQDSSDFISDQDYSESFSGENNSQSNTPTSNIKHNSIRRSRKTLELRGDLDLNAPISGKRKAAIAANRGIENANKFFDKDIRKTIKTLKETYEPFVYDPREILNKLNYSPNSSNGASKKILKERNV